MTNGRKPSGVGVLKYPYTESTARKTTTYVNPYYFMGAERSVRAPAQPTSRFAASATPPSIIRVTGGGFIPSAYHSRPAIRGYERYDPKTGRTISAQEATRRIAIAQQLGMIRPYGQKPIAQVGFRRAQKGFKGTISKPTYLLVGESGKEKVSVKPVRNGLRRIQKRRKRSSGTRSGDYDFQKDFRKMMNFKF